MKLFPLGTLRKKPFERDPSQDSHSAAKSTSDPRSRFSAEAVVAALTVLPPAHLLVVAARMPEQ
jgi:hypothetical protein